MNEIYKQLVDQLAAAKAEAAAAATLVQQSKADAARFAWYMSDTGKPAAFMDEFFFGVQNGWTLQQWRDCIDRYRSAS